MLGTATTDSGAELFTTSEPDLQSPRSGETSKPQENHLFSYDIDSTCSTPFVSAPSSPGRNPVGFFYSAPASPMHFVLASSAAPQPLTVPSSGDITASFEFDFSTRLPSNRGGDGSGAGTSMSSADELFLNGQIRPMKLSTHLQRPQVLAPLLDAEEGENDSVEIEAVRGRDLRLRSRSLRRRTRSMSPLRSLPFPWQNDDDYDDSEIKIEESKVEEELDDSDKVALELQRKEEKDEDEARSSMESTPSMSASSSRSSSAGRSSKRWIFLKDFLYRSKSEGRSSSSSKFWFPPGKEKKLGLQVNKLTKTAEVDAAMAANKKSRKKTVANGVGKRRVPASAHERHYTANRAQAEELRRKTYLPYRQGLLGCLGFSSKSYGAINGFARALNPVSSRYQWMILHMNEPIKERSAVQPPA